MDLPNCFSSVRRARRLDWIQIQFDVRIDEPRFMAILSTAARRGPELVRRAADVWAGYVSTLACGNFDETSSATRGRDIDDFVSAVRRGTQTRGRLEDVYTAAR